MVRKRRLFWQLYPSILLITLMSVAAVTWFASRSLKQSFIDQYESDLEARARLLKEQFLKHLTSPEKRGIDLLCKEIGAPAATRITVISPSGEVLGDSEEDPLDMDNHMDRTEVINAFTNGVGMSIRYSRTLQKDMMYVGVTLEDNSGVMGVIRTSIPLAAIDETLGSIRKKIVVGGIVISFFVAIISLLVSRRISRPIEEIRKGAECFARGELERRLPVFNSEEIGGLSETMNQMASELHERINTIMQQRNELDAVLASMVEGVIAVDMEERVISMNKAAAQIFGCNVNDIQGRAIQEVVRDTALLEFVTTALYSREPVEKDIVTHDESEKLLSGHGTVLYDAENNRRGALIVLHDVTRLLKLENIRRDFVANVSHEMKTPVTAIKGFVETLQDGAIINPSDVTRFLEIIKKHADRLEAIIEDLLALSRIEQDAEREEIVLTEGSVRDLLLAAIQSCDVIAQAGKIRIELSCSEQIRSEFDAGLLEQAMVNLIDNAVKYGNDNGVVQVKAIETDGEVVINVRDNGRGIDKHHIPRLFERFYRADKARSRKLGGTGLGLAIVKHIIQTHGGQVTVESAPGEGSTFSIHLPRF
ncbi:MAG: PAS domain-containing protein [Deltaproteobacteria bacterium]|nr:PAS domain-containing protein [Deltaproteobacteria bacterium]